MKVSLSSLIEKIVAPITQRLELHNTEVLIEQEHVTVSLFMLIYGVLFNTYIMIDMIVRNRPILTFVLQIAIVYIYTILTFLLSRFIKQKNIRYFITNSSGSILLVLLTVFFYEQINLSIWTILFVIMIIGIVRLKPDMMIYVVLTGLALDVYLFIAYPDQVLTVMRYYYVAHFIMHLILGMVSVVANRVLRYNIIRNIERYQDEREKNDEISSLYEELLASEDELRSKTEQILAYNLQIQKNEKRLYDLAYYDTLTQIPNRKLFMDRINEAADKGGKEGKSFSVIIIDIDNFKLINDNKGHVVGDEYLCAIASRFQQAVGDHLIGRIGGDEFAVIVYNDTDGAVVTQVAQKLLDCFNEPIRINNEAIYSGASLGVGRYPTDSADPVELINCADIAMYQSKNRGKNQVHFYNKDMGKAFGTREG